MPVSWGRPLSSTVENCEGTLKEMDLSPTRIGLGSFDCRGGDIVFGINRGYSEMTSVFASPVVVWSCPSL